MSNTLCATATRTLSPCARGLPGLLQDLTLKSRPGVILGFLPGAPAPAPCRPPVPFLRLWEDPEESGVYRLVTGDGFRRRMEALDRASAAFLLGPIPGGLDAMRAAFGLPRRRRKGR